MSKVLIILSGCGVFDGSEIHETVITMLHLDRHDATVTFAAPDRDQMHVVNHLTGEPTAEKRNIRIESARIARGQVEDLASIKGDQYDAVILPGGFGAAKNLCDFAVKGPDCTVDPDVARVLEEAHAAGRPIGLCCIAPTIGAKLFPGSTLTIGSDPATAGAIEAMGANHRETPTEGICEDAEAKIVTTPAYMTALRIGEVDAGIGALIDRVMALA